jgi:predicted glycoside hydrolase/deacetylase ChbG (UPF0249 family)
MRRLIINADDCGVNAPRTHAIFTCMEEGIVTSTTVLPNMPDALHAARKIKERDISAGLHINLTEGSALTAERDVLSLLDTRGYLLGRKRLFEALEEGVIAVEHIEREIRSQIEWYFDHAGMPTHCDSHHNVHVHPTIAPLIGPILSRYGIGKVRVAIETLDRLPWEISAERRAFIEQMNIWGSAAKRIFESQDLHTTDHFRGFAFSGQANARRLRHLLAALPEGTTELMVHPGTCDPLGDDFSRDPQRETERNMLLDPELPAYLGSRGIELIGFGDL